MLLEKIKSQEACQDPFCGSDIIEFIHTAFGIQVCSTWPYQWQKRNKKIISIVNAQPLEAARAKLHPSVLRAYGDSI